MSEPPGVITELLDLIRDVPHCQDTDLLFPQALMIFRSRGMIPEEGCSMTDTHRQNLKDCVSLLPPVASEPLKSVVSKIVEFASSSPREAPNFSPSPSRTPLVSASIDIDSSPALVALALYSLQPPTSELSAPLSCRMDGAASSSTADLSVNSSRSPRKLKSILITSHPDRSKITDQQPTTTTTTEGAPSSNQTQDLESSGQTKPQKIVKRVTFSVPEGADREGRLGTPPRPRGRKTRSMTLGDQFPGLRYTEKKEDGDEAEGSENSGSEDQIDENESPEGSSSSGESGDEYDPGQEEEDSFLEDPYEDEGRPRKRFKSGNLAKALKIAADAEKSDSEISENKKKRKKSLKSADGETCKKTKTKKSSSPEGEENGKRNSDENEDGNAEDADSKKSKPNKKKRKERPDEEKEKDNGESSDSGESGEKKKGGKSKKSSSAATGKKKSKKSAAAAPAVDGEVEKKQKLPLGFMGHLCLSILQTAGRAMTYDEILVEILKHEWPVPLGKNHIKNCFASYFKGDFKQLGECFTKSGPGKVESSQEAPKMGSIEEIRCRFFEQQQTSIPNLLHGILKKEGRFLWPSELRIGVQAERTDVLVASIQKKISAGLEKKTLVRNSEGKIGLPGTWWLKPNLDQPEGEKILTNGEGGDSSAASDSAPAPDAIPPAATTSENNENVEVKKEGESLDLNEMVAETDIKTEDVQMKEESLDQSNPRIDEPETNSTDVKPVKA